MLDQEVTGCAKYISATLAQRRRNAQRAAKAFWRKSYLDPKKKWYFSNPGVVRMSLFVGWSSTNKSIEVIHSF